MGSSACIVTSRLYADLLFASLVSPARLDHEHLPTTTTIHYKHSGQVNPSSYKDHPFNMQPSIATAKSWGRLAQHVLRLNVATGLVCALTLLFASSHAALSSGASTAYHAVNTVTPAIALTLALINIHAWSRRHLSTDVCLYSAFVMMGAWMATIVLQTIFGYQRRWNDTMHTQQLTGAHGMPAAMVAYYLKLAAAGLAMMLQFGQLIVSAAAVHAREKAALVHAIDEAPERYQDEE